MAVKIRLKQLGRKNRPFYRLVVTDARSPRDGAVTETIGWYNPHETAEDRHLSVNAERVRHWLDNGAELTEKAACLVRKAAPAVLREQTERLVARRAKAAAKRKVRRQKKAAASA